MTITTKEILKWLREGIEVAARSGYDDETRVLEKFEERVRDEFRDHSDEERTEQTTTLMQELRVALKKQREAESGWSTATTNDHIDEAFEELESRGIVAMQNAGYTMSDGWDDVHGARGGVEGAWGGGVFLRTRRGAGRSPRGTDAGVRSVRVGPRARNRKSARRQDRLRGDEKSTASKPNGAAAPRAEFSVVPFEWRKRRYTKAP